MNIYTYDPPLRPFSAWYMHMQFGRLYKELFYLFKMKSLLVMIGDDSILRETIFFFKDLMLR